MDLTQALITKGGYNATDAANAASGPRAAELSKEFGVGSGGGGINFSFPDIKLSDIGGSSYDLAKSQGSQVSDAFGKYADYVKGLEQPLDIYNRLEGEAGIPTLRKTATSLSGQVNDLEDTIRRVEGNVSDTSRNSLLTEGQRQNLVTETKRPLTEDLGWLSQSLGRVLQGIQLGTQDINNKTGLAMRGQDRISDVYKQGVDQISQQAAREMTGFTADRQDRLNILLTKLQSQQSLATTEWQEANDLAKEQRGYDFQREEFSKQLSTNTQMVTINGSQKLINPQTGAIIKDLGPSSAPSSGGGSNSGIAQYLQAVNGGANNALMGSSDWEYYG